MSITLILVILTCIVSYFCLNDRALFERLKHSPSAEWHNKEWYRLVTSGFVHGSWIHLGVNMFVFYQFGQIVESFFVQIFGSGMGGILFIMAYILTIIAADLPTLFQHKDNPNYGAIGASGAVSGILFIYVLFLPWKLMYFYGIIPVPGILMAFIFLAYESYAAKNSNDNIDHSAHFYGAIFGVIYMIAVYPRIIGDFFYQLTENFPL